MDIVEVLSAKVRTGPVDSTDWWERRWRRKSVFFTMKRFLVED